MSTRLFGRLPRAGAKLRLCENAGISLGILAGAPGKRNRVIPFGEHYGEPAVRKVPGRGNGSRTAARLIGSRAHPRPASVETAAPSRQDRAPRLTTCANLFQVQCPRRAAISGRLVSDGYCLQNISARMAARGPIELLRRRSAMPTARACWGPQRKTAGMACRSYVHLFTDSRRKMQCILWRQSGFDSLSRTLPFMMTEGRHMVVGETRHKPRRAANAKP